MGDRGQREAWVTLATNDAYALGCLVLGNSLRRVATTRQLVVMVTEGVSQSMRNQLGTVFDRVVDVSLLDSQDARNLSLLGRPDLNVTFTKIHCWKLVEYEKCVFLDADTLVIQHCDELFDREEFSAAPDAGWPDCFNSGVFVFRPSLETYNAILNFAWSIGSFDGGDQGLLNRYFSSWPTEDIMKHLPFIYNVVSQAFYSYLPAFEQFKNNIKIVHFIGPIKPWNHPYNTATRMVTVFPETGHCQQFLQMWWDLFMETVQPCLDPTMGGLVGELAQMKVGDGSEGADYMVLDDRERRLAWERGQADYLGVDCFDNIMKKIEGKMAPTPSPSSSTSSLKKSEGNNASGTSLPLKPPELLPQPQKRPYVVKRVRSADRFMQGKDRGRRKQRSVSVGSPPKEHSHTWRIPFPEGGDTGQELDTDTASLTSKMAVLSTMVNMAVSVSGSSLNSSSSLDSSSSIE